MFNTVRLVKKIEIYYSNGANCLLFETVLYFLNLGAVHKRRPHKIEKKIDPSLLVWSAKFPHCLNLFHPWSC